MKVKDLVPFIENVYFKNGKTTGQKFLSYGKILELEYKDNTKKEIRFVFVLIVHEIQKYIDCNGVYFSNTDLYLHQVKKYTIFDLPEEFKSILYLEKLDNSTIFKEN
jgi:hypothetical protein